MNRSGLEHIKSGIEFSYSRWGNKLVVNDKGEFMKNSSDLGYCYKLTTDDGSSLYKVVVSKVGDQTADFQVLMHEYGHIYFGHLEGLHEELDSRLLWTIMNHREELEKQINERCGITFARTLLDKVIDDPDLNHNLHNIAMDMEVNSKFFTVEDLEYVENAAGRLVEERMMASFDGKELGDEEKKKIKDSAAVKLIHPSRYHYPGGEPFESELGYADYLILIVEHLDQFVKMMVALKLGMGTGGMGSVTGDQINDALGNQGENVSDFLKDMGMSQDNKQPPKDGGAPEDCPWSKDPKEADHHTESRDIADENREAGKIKPSSGSFGRGTEDVNAFRDVDTNADPIETAIDEVMKSFKKKVVKIATKKLPMWRINRGIDKSDLVIPVYREKRTLTFDPTVVFLIDVSGSMDDYLIDRILNSIRGKMRSFRNGYKYSIITCNTKVRDHFKNVDPKKPIPTIHSGGGTEMAEGIKFFRDNYSQDAILVLISDFCDDLGAWHEVEAEMKGYVLYGFNYGYRNYKQKFTNMIIKDFTSRNGY